MPTSAMLFDIADRNAKVVEDIQKQLFTSYFNLRENNFKALH